MKKTIFILSAFIFFYSVQYAQNLRNKEKIDPAFKSLIYNKKLQGKKKSSSATKVPEAKVNSSKNEATAKKFECIIYTKNAKALKDKGIIIHSTLPTFVTAIVSLQQIEQLAAMSDVTYIEAAKENYPKH